MALLPAVCEQCGLLQESPALRLSEGAQVAIANLSIESPCLRCGGTARIVEGLYEAVGDTVRLLVESPEEAKQLQALLDRLKTIESEEEAEKAISAIPSAQPLLALVPREKKKNGHKWVATIGTIIMLALTAYQQCQPGPVTEKQLKDALDRAVQTVTAPAPKKNRAERRRAGRAPRPKHHK